MIRADMHIHTYYSDGGQSPAEVVRAAKARGVGLIAVTDHDNSNGRKEVKELALRAGIISVDGEEISAYDGDIKVHMLAYAMDYSDPAYTAFNKRLTEGAEERAFDILKKLAAVGVKLSYGEVIRERRCKKSPVHATYIAVAGARKGYANSPYSFYTKYLNYGAAGFSCICRPTPEETAEVVKRCGGFCSLAHPARISADRQGVISLIERLIPCGLRGIEAVYSGHTAKETAYYKETAKTFSLEVTGGSDVHRIGGSREIGRPVFRAEGVLAKKLGF